GSGVGQDRRAPQGRADRPPSDRDQQLDRVLAEGRLVGPHRPSRPGRCRIAGECARLPDRRDAAWRPARRGSAARPVSQHAQPARPALRSLFYAVEAWVPNGVEPPGRRVPRLADGTAVKAETLRLPRVKGFALAPGANRILPPVDWVDPPEAEPPQAYETFVS